jgi:four helix bundle protein
MGVRRFEDLVVWRVSRELASEIGVILRSRGLAGDHAIRDQLNAAAISIMANIAEGFTRQGSREFAHYLRIARGSNAETRALLHAALDRHHISPAEHARLVEMTESIGRMLCRLEQTVREWAVPAFKPSRRRANREP